MIRRLRSRHRAISVILLLVLPPLLLLSLSSRKSIPVMDALPFGQETFELSKDMNLVFSSNSLWEGIPITTFLFTKSDKHLLVLLPDAALPFPDLLLYWQKSLIDKPEQLSKTAALLGTLSSSSGGRFILEPSLIEAGGAFVLYSLGHKKVISKATLSAQAIEKGGLQ